MKNEDIYHHFEKPSLNEYKNELEIFTASILYNMIFLFLEAPRKKCKEAQQRQMFSIFKIRSISG